MLNVKRFLCVIGLIYFSIAMYGNANLYALVGMIGSVFQFITLKNVNDNSIWEYLKDKAKLLISKTDDVS